MSKRRAYHSCDVKNVVPEKLSLGAPDGGVTVGLDIGKLEIFAVLRWNDGTFERPWKVRNPSEIMMLVRLLQNIAQERPVTVAMESTGTYGDALRQALTDNRLDVHRVSGKACHDYSEIFDGVPSSHDGKDAAIVAELTAIGKSWPWPYQQKSEQDAKLAYLVDRLDAHQTIQMTWIGRLEALVARHWPEVTRLLRLTSVSLLKTLSHYGGPMALARDPDAAQRLAGWGRHVLKGDKIDKVLRSAAATSGVRQNDQDILQLKEYAACALAALREVQGARRELTELAKGNEVIRRQAEVVGTVTACVLWSSLGDPNDYHCSEAYRKAMGLNLKERSSGKHKGQLKITKRGPAIVRRWMYFAALRHVQDPLVKGWFESKKARDGGRGKGAVIAVTRRLALALYNVGVGGELFESWRLFPGSSTARRSLQSQQKACGQPEKVSAMARQKGPPLPPSPPHRPQRALGEGRCDGEGGRGSRVPCS